MPGLEEEKGYDKVQDVCRQERNDKCEEQLVFVKVRERELIVRCLDLDRSNCDEDRCEDQIHHHTRPKVNLCHVEFVRSLRSITQSEYEAGEQDC